MDNSLRLAIDSLIRKSIEYAYLNHYKELTEYVKKHSQEMSEDVMRKHIELYVNNFSITLGEEGKKSIHKLLEVYWRVNQLASFHEQIFLDITNP